jgi:hypothetical protein
MPSITSFANSIELFVTYRFLPSKRLSPLLIESAALRKSAFFWRLKYAERLKFNALPAERLLQEGIVSLRCACKEA